MWSYSSAAVSDEKVCSPTLLKMWLYGLIRYVHYNEQWLNPGKFDLSAQRWRKAPNVVGLSLLHTTKNNRHRRWSNATFNLPLSLPLHQQYLLSLCTYCTFVFIHHYWPARKAFYVFGEQQWHNKLRMQQRHILEALFVWAGVGVSDLWWFCPGGFNLRWFISWGLSYQ